MSAEPRSLFAAAALDARAVSFPLPSLLVLEHDVLPYFSDLSLRAFLDRARNDGDVIFPVVGGVPAAPERAQTDEEVLTLRTDTPDLPKEVLTAYKRVDRKIKPVPAVFPEEAKVIRSFPENPLDSLPPLPIVPPEFKENGRLTQEYLEALNFNQDGFLWPEEEKLFTYIFQTHQNHFVFEDSQRGSFRDDYFSPYIIPVIPHEPWAFGNIPIPPGIKQKVVDLLKEKMLAGVYEPSQSSYRSRWFCVLKKNGKLRIVHDLQPLNKVTIKEAGLPPNLDDFVEPFAGRVCYTVFDLYWGFDARKVHPTSRDLTAFQTPLGLLRITSLPTGFTNSPSEFQACMSFILQDEIPHVANIFIDDLPIKGPSSEYLDENGKPETIKGNPGIRRFIWEHAQDVHRVVHRVGHAGGTFSPFKTQLARREVLVVGQKCTPQGRLPDDLKIQRILDWKPPRDVKDVRGFLGLCGTVRIWIKNYSQRARPLTELIRKDEPFEWNERRQAAFNDLKEAVTSPPALRPIDYSTDLPVILSVDSSYIGVGFILSQLDEQGRKRPARYGSIPMNEREARYSQPKLELYGLFRALRAYRLHLIGVKNLRVEVDAKYIKGMLNDPDLQPNATINRWIQGILLFDFTLVHVPADKHRGPDALSRREPDQGEFSSHDNDDDWLDNIALLIRTGGPVKAAARAKKQTPALVWLQMTPKDQEIEVIRRFLTTLELPPTKTTQDRKRFLKKAARYFIQNDSMYRRNGTGPVQKVIQDLPTRRRILEAAHEQLGHRGEYAVMQTLKTRFYWPSLWTDTREHVRSCHECQVRSVRKVETPLLISSPTAIFAKIYLDVMYMPRLGERRPKYIVAARDDLSGASEGRALVHNSADAVADFLWEEVLCRYGAIGQVTTDNGPETKAAFEQLAKKYHIPHVRISEYNSKANGVVERGHFTIREAIMKACQGNFRKWPEYVSYAFYADRISVRRATGFSPFYLLYGVNPVLPFDLTEACFLVTYQANMTSAELLEARIRQLQKKPDDLAEAAAVLTRNRIKSKEEFERRFYSRLTRDHYEPGTLVLVRNTAVEKELDHKVKPRYLGPMKVRKRTQNGSYILEELDGTVLRQKVAGFRIVPYVSREDTDLLKLVADHRKNEELAERRRVRDD